jgi:hypothetical protein
MAIPNEVRGVRMATAYFFVRIFVCLFGIGSVVWAGLLLPSFWNQASGNRIASELLEGHAFKRQALTEEARRYDAAEQSSFCTPTELHNSVVLHLTILNEAIVAKDPNRIEAAYNPLYDVTRKALSCSPSDSFAWLTLFWLDAARHGFQPDNANYLRLSYALGPNEGWIALWRSRIAITMFERLPNDLKTDAVDEFIKLVDMGLYPQAVEIFTSATPAVQNRIALQLKYAKAIPRQIFARTLYQNGLDIDIPGVDRPARPWQ